MSVGTEFGVIFQLDGIFFSVSHLLKVLWGHRRYKNATGRIRQQSQCGLEANILVVLLNSVRDHLLLNEAGAILLSSKSVHTILNDYLWVWVLNFY